MKVKRFAQLFGYSIIGVLVPMGVLSPQVRAQEHGTARTALHHGPAADNALVRVVRESTERFRDVEVAEAEGYHLLFGCVSGPDSGAMGLHYVNLALVGDGELDPARPEIVIYEPTQDGRLRLVGADYLVFAEAWDQKGVRYASTHGTAPALVREPEPLRVAGVLYAACLGVEGEPHRHVRELARQDFLRGIQRRVMSGIESCRTSTGNVRRPRTLHSQ